MTHYAIIGREDGDDEDTCFITNAIDQVSAVAEFEEMILGPHRDAATIYVNYVLASASPITILESNTTQNFAPPD